MLRRQPPAPWHRRRGSAAVVLPAVLGGISGAGGLRSILPLSPAPGVLEGVLVVPDSCRI